MMIEEQSPTVEVAASRLVVTDDYAVEDPPVEDAAPAPLKDHPLVPRILEEVGALNNWVSLNREWDVTCRKFTLANKVSVIATTEHYLRAVHVSGATFLNEIREARLNMPVTIDKAQRITELLTHMLTKCPRNKARSVEPLYINRSLFLLFLLEVYKCAVNNRNPSRTGELNLINNFIVSRVHEFIFGDKTQLLYTDGKQVFYASFPTHHDIYTALKEKQISRDSNERKRVKRKRESIEEKVNIIKNANKDLVAGGFPPAFSSPSRLIVNLVQPSPVGTGLAARPGRLGQQKGVSSSTYAVREITVSSSSKSATKSTTFITPLKSCELAPISASDIRSLIKKASKLSRKSKKIAEKRKEGSHNLKAAKVANVAGSLFGEASDDEYDGRLPGERNRLLGKEDAEVSTLLRRSEEKGRSDDGSSSDGCEESSIDEDGDSDEGSSSDERGRRDEDSDGEGSA